MGCAKDLIVLIQMSLIGVLLICEATITHISPEFLNWMVVFSLF
jgi:hypothetical protein